MWPHAPQSAAAVEVSTHAVLHSMPPAVQVHTPARQLCPVPHACPHDPQFAASASESTHRPLQSVVPGEQAHTPAAHARPVVHAVPQFPQFAGSPAVSTHRPPQRARPPGHVQRPLTHALPPTHAVPQPPQFWLSAVMSTHMPSHAVAPSPQATASTAASVESSGPSRAPSIAPASSPPSRGISELIQFWMQPRSWALNGAAPSGIRAPHGGVASEIFRYRIESPGRPGATSIPVQDSAGTLTSLLSRSADARSSPPARSAAVWQPDDVQCC